MTKGLSDTFSDFQTTTNRFQAGSMTNMQLERHFRHLKQQDFANSDSFCGQAPTVLDEVLVKFH